MKIIISLHAALIGYVMAERRHLRHAQLKGDKEERVGGGVAYDNLVIALFLSHQQWFLNSGTNVKVQATP